MKILLKVCALSALLLTSTANAQEVELDRVAAVVNSGVVLESEIKEQVDILGLQNDIIFVGFRRDIPEILPEFDLFLFTSNNEPTGGVLLESYACRVPIVAANAGGIPEVIVDNVTGLLAEVGNPISFADKVEQMLNDKQLQEKCKANGRQFLIDNFTKEVIAKKMYNELNEVLLNSKI